MGSYVAVSKNLKKIWNAKLQDVAALSGNIHSQLRRFFTFGNRTWSRFDCSNIVSSPLRILDKTTNTNIHVEVLRRKTPGQKMRGNTGRGIPVFLGVKPQYKLKLTNRTCSFNTNPITRAIVWFFGASLFYPTISAICPVLTSWDVIGSLFKMSVIHLAGHAIHSYHLHSLLPCLLI